MNTNHQQLSSGIDYFAAFSLPKQDDPFTGKG